MMVMVVMVIVMVVICVLGVITLICRKEVTMLNRDFAKAAMNGKVTEGKFPTPFPPSEVG